MSEIDIKIDQSVAILIDGNNIERSLEHVVGGDATGWMVSFDRLVPKLVGQRALNRLLYFREGRNISKSLADRLHKNFYGRIIPCHKSADVPLSIAATQIADKVDTIIIMSGDSDYVDLVRHLRGAGVRVEVVAVEKTTAGILKNECDYFTAIVKDDLFHQKKRGPRKGGSRKKAAPKKSEDKKDEDVQTPEVVSTTVNPESGPAETVAVKQEEKE